MADIYGINKMHGKYQNAVKSAQQGAKIFLQHQGESKDYTMPSHQFPAQNPLSATGKKVLSSMKEQYGGRGEEVFYKSINKGIKGSKKWHK